jgi:Ca2+/Na+ antiporter
MDAFWHFVLIGWKVFYALIPPPHYGGGLPCFGVALAFIGITTAIVGEFAELFGCVIGLKPTVTAITFVALGTSLPDTFASMTAAQSEKYADAAIGNVTGSNSVNVFLGLGLPWILGSMFEARNSNNPEGGYFVPSGALGFSVVVFLICACTCLVILVIRRIVVGGELGGVDRTGRLMSAVVLVSLWLLYIIMSSLQAYGMIPMPDHYFGIDVTTKHYDSKCNF